MWSYIGVAIVCLVAIALYHRKLRKRKEKEKQDMAFGLITNNENGDRVIDSNTFTVRLVATKVLRLGQMAAGSVVHIPVPDAKVGMFAQVTPLFGVPLNQTLGIVDEGEKTPYSDRIPAAPTVTVENGSIAVAASANAGGGGTLGDCAVYVLAN